MNNVCYEKFGFRRIAVVSPKLSLGLPDSNAKKIIELAKECNKNKSFIALFPELSLTGYTCEDLFHSSDLMEQIVPSIDRILKETKNLNTLIVFGSPYQSSDGRIYNVAVVCLKGQMLALIPKSHLPNYKEFYEMRWFTSGKGVNQVEKILNQEVLLSSSQLIKINGELIGIEICEDLWSLIPPSSEQALAGASIILNLSASNELVGKKDYRKELVSQQSSRLNAVYAYASAGAMESTKDVVFSGHCLVYENGTLLVENERFSFEDSISYADIDMNKIAVERRKNTTFSNQHSSINFTIVEEKMNYVLENLSRSYEPMPFVPKSLNNDKLDDRLEEILNIQSSGLVRRMKGSKSEKMLLGLSGGLDSTLAALVCLKALNKMNKPSTDLITVSMPGFGTSERTKKQSFDLAKELKSTFMEIDITEVTTKHLKDIEHENVFDNTYENAQARERTQILFDLANKHKGIVIGTGNLSESALGWCTFNGDQTSNYSVNTSIPKTLVKHLVKYYAAKSEKELKDVLTRVVETKISPELLPSKNGEIQSTEDLVGPYELNDFYMFHYLRNGFSKEKIQILALRTFSDRYDKNQIIQVLNSFFKRFKQQQFKRTTFPPGPKVGSVSLSPRGDWRFPDELGESE